VTADRELAVRERAYALWRQEGCLEGRALDHWFRAEAEIAFDPPAQAPDGEAVAAASSVRKTAVRRALSRQPAKN